MAELRNKIIPGVVIDYDQDVNFTVKPILSVTKYALKRSQIDWLLKAQEYNLSNLGELTKLCLMSKNYDETEITSFYEGESGEISSICYYLNRYGKRNFQKLLACDKLIQKKFSFNNNKIMNKYSNEILGHTSKTSLLYGPTGSGKTRIYLDVASSFLHDQKQVLLMLPEVALTENFCQSVFNILGFKPHVWNYRAHELAKRAIWEWAHSGEGGLIIGSRSSLWLPFHNLGLIIVDEEHDQSYKQDNSPIYNARDMAILRAHYENAKCLLVSATPSLETWYNYIRGKYQKLAITGHQPIEVKIRQITDNKWMSEDLFKEIIVTLHKKEQCMLFLNRRGFASAVLCESCNYIYECSQCSANVIFYNNEIVQCSYCNEKKMIKNCIKCHSNTWNLRGMGIESVHEKIGSMFPTARIITLSSDTIQPSLAIESIYKGEVDIVISTQILSKGYTFPHLTLVAVIHSCQGLVKMDPRSYEKVYQLLTQVRGRCGRNNLPSTFLVQTNSKNHDLINTLIHGEYEVWATSELKKRELYCLPPFYSIIRFIISSKYPKRSLEDANKLYTELYKIKKITTFPPAIAPLYKCRNQFRYNIIVRYPLSIYPQRVIRKMVDEIAVPNKSRIIVDVDPQVFI